MELYSLKVFLTVANEKSFSRAGEKLLRTQPAISLAIQRLEAELGEKLIDRSGKDLILTDAGCIVLEYCRRSYYNNSDRGVRGFAIRQALTNHARQLSGRLGLYRVAITNVAG